MHNSWEFMTPLEKRNELYTRWLACLRALYEEKKHEKRFEEVDIETIRLLCDLIYSEKYRLKPLSCIYLAASDVDVKYMEFKGVPVSVVSTPPEGLDVQYQSDVKYKCLYMYPPQELALIALGRALWETLSNNGQKIEAVVSDLCQQSSVSELLIIRYERCLTSVRPSKLWPFIQKQLKDVDGINDYVRSLLQFCILTPYVNCWRTVENRLPPLSQSNLYLVSGETLPFGLYLMESVYPIPYLDQFYLSIYLTEKLLPLLDDCPEEYQHYIYFFYFYHAIVIPRCFPADFWSHLKALVLNKKNPSYTSIIPYFQEKAKQAGIPIEVECYSAGDGRIASTLFTEFEVLPFGKIRCRNRT